MLKRNSKCKNLVDLSLPLQIIITLEVILMLQITVPEWYQTLKS